MENQSQSGTNTILLVLILVVIVGALVWFFRGAATTEQPKEEGFNVDVTLPSGQGGGDQEDN